MSVLQTQGDSSPILTSLALASRTALMGLPVLLLSASSAVAQQPGTAEKATSTVKYGGVLHVHSGTWTRRTDQFGPSLPDIIFSNTAESGYFASLGGSGNLAPGSENFDAGGLPGLTNKTPFVVGANRDTYRVNGYQIGYCDLGAPLTGGWEVSFYESYEPCTFDDSPVARILSTGLPANGCWLIDIDLSGGEEFDIAADGGDGWQDDPLFDSFGWSYRYVGTDPNDRPAGFLLSGDPDSTDPFALGAGTYYGGPSICSGNTGYLIDDNWFVEDPDGAISGCFFFGGYSNANGCNAIFNPHASFHMEIYAEQGELPGIGKDYCPSTLNSTGAMTTLTASGSEVAADDTVVLLASNMPAGALSFLITSQTQGSVPSPGGSSGDLCVVGDVGRFMSAGQVKFSGADGTFSLATTLGEWSTVTIPQATPPLFYTAMGGQTSSFQLWHRDAVMGAGTSNFSNGLAITWQ